MQSGLCNCKPKFSLPGPRGPGASKAQPPRGLIGHCTSGRPLNPPLSRMCPFWMLLEVRLLEVVLTTAAIRRAKLQSNRRHRQTNTELFTGRTPFLSPNQQCQSTRGNKLLLNYVLFCASFTLHTCSHLLTCNSEYQSSLKQKNGTK